MCLVNLYFHSCSTDPEPRDALPAVNSPDMDTHRYDLILAELLQRGVSSAPDKEPGSGKLDGHLHETAFHSEGCSAV